MLIALQIPTTKIYTHTRARAFKAAGNLLNLKIGEKKVIVFVQKRVDAAMTSENRLNEQSRNKLRFCQACRLNVHRTPFENDAMPTANKTGSRSVAAAAVTKTTRTVTTSPPPPPSPHYSSGHFAERNA